MKPSSRRIPVENLLRCIGIALIVLNHAFSVPHRPFEIGGGANILLLLAGFSFARLSLSHYDEQLLRRSIVKIIWSILLPCYIVMIIYGAWSRHLDWREFLFISTFFKIDQEIPFYSWYPQIILQTMILFYIISLFSGTLIRISRNPLLFSLIAYLASIALYCVTVVVLDLADGYDRLLQYYLWNFLLGIVLYFSTREEVSRQNSILIAVFSLALSYLVFAHQHQWMRAAVLTVSVFTLIRFRNIPLPRPVAQFVAITSQATLIIFLTHIIFLYAFEKLQLREFKEGFHPRDIAFAWTFMMAGSLSLWIAFESIRRAWRFCSSEISPSAPSTAPQRIPGIAWPARQLEPARTLGRGASRPDVGVDHD